MICNCLILGSGRSGTSMIAGSLAKAGYYMGENLHRANPGNPKGFFEDEEINGINEALLAQVLRARPKLLGDWFFRSRPVQGQRWLSRLPLGTNIPCPHDIAERIQRVTRRQPYCFKDPRFSYTLPAWRPWLGNTVFVCVFRDPESTAQSILKECNDAHYVDSLSINFNQALQVWSLMYRHILDIHRREGAWLFLHYDQVLGGDGLSRLETFVDAPVDRSFPEVSLRRSFFRHPVPGKTLPVYQQLCQLAGWEDRTIEPKSLQI